MSSRIQAIQGALICAESIDKKHYVFQDDNGIYGYVDPSEWYFLAEDYSIITDVVYPDGGVDVIKEGTDL